MKGYYLNTRSVGVKIFSLGQPVVQSENTHTCMDEDHDMLGFIPAPFSQVKFCADSTKLSKSKVLPMNTK